MHKDTTKIRAIEKDIRIWTYLALTGAEYKTYAFRALCMKEAPYHCHLCAWISRAKRRCWDCPANMGEDFYCACIYSERSMFARWYCAKSKKARKLYAQRFLDLLWEWRMNEAERNWPHHVADYVEPRDITKIAALQGELAIWTGYTDIWQPINRPVRPEMSLTGKFRYAPLCTWVELSGGGCSQCPASFGYKGLRGCENHPDSPLTKFYACPTLQALNACTREWLVLLRKWLKEAQAAKQRNTKTRKTC